MKAVSLTIQGIILLEPKIFCDGRGYIFESFNQKTFEETIGLSPKFVQDNHSKSTKGVLRGLHYQLPPKAQGKLVRVIQGEIFDAVVDIRKESPTFGQWLGEKLSADNKKQLWIPPGFAHGFLTLSETAEVLYKATEFYSPEFEQCIAWNDPDIGIEWPLQSEPIISKRDHSGMLLKKIRI